MDEAAASLDFERAAELRDALHHLESMDEPTVVLSIDGGDRDVLGYARDGDDAASRSCEFAAASCWRASTSFSRTSKEETDGAVLQAYLAGGYLPLDDRATELLVPFDPDERELVEASLENTKIIAPQRGPRRELVDLAAQNARHLLEELRLTGEEADERAGDPIYELQRPLGLQKVPRAIVCFDISHAQGTDTVASCVWFQNGRPYRAEYRKFKVKTVEGIDDFASMHEVVTRYFTRRLEEDRPLPDLVLIDGGKGQLNAAAAALESLSLGAMPIVSLAKREEELFLMGRPDPLRLPRRSPALRVLQQARDEAHRFAITFQRKRRSLRTMTSELLRVPGIGEAKRRQLLEAFGSLQGVRDASPEAIAALPGFGRKTADRIVEALQRSSPTAAPVEASTVETEQDQSETHAASHTADNSSDIT